LAAIPEEDIWLASQKSARTRRAYRQDVAYFMRTLGIIARERIIRGKTAPPRPRSAGGSS